MAKRKKRKRQPIVISPERSPAITPVTPPKPFTTTTATPDSVSAPEDVGELLSIPRLCQYLGISRATLYRLNPPGRLKIGNQVRFSKAVIDRWIQTKLSKNS